MNKMRQIVPQAYPWARRVPALLLAGVLMLAPGALAETYELPLFVADTASGQEGVLRVLNLSDEAGTVDIHAVDDAGTRTGPATLSLGALASVELGAADLAFGNGARGLSGGLGAFAGDARLEFDTDLGIQYVAQLRSADGTRVAIHDAVRLDPVEVEGGFEYLVPVFNPASNMAQGSRLRLTNPTDQPVAVGIEGRDDAGAAATGGSVGLTLPAGGAATLTAQQLEAGDPSITGQLGAGSGGWRLRVSADRPIRVVNLVLASTGRLDNLSTAGLAGSAPHSQSAFAARFGGVSIGADSGDRRITLDFGPGGEFAESVEEGGATVSDAGTYTYARAGERVGRVTMEYDDGETCVLNVHFTSATAGWYASRCVGPQIESYWTGGAWSVADDTEPPPVTDTSPTLSATGRPGDQTFGVGTAIAPLSLPAATGGDGTLTYSLTPQIPGLTFDPATRELTGTPTASGTHRVTYTVTDADGDSDTLSFTITVQAAGGGTTDGECRVGQLVSPGESCNYPGTDDAFSVDDDGRGSFLVISSGRAININNVTFNGKHYDFRASHQGDGVWRIDRLEGSTTPPTGGGGGSNTSPEFPSNASPGDQTYTVGTAIATLTLPEATGGDGALTYSLSPGIPGLSFDPVSRRLTGTPTAAGAHSMTYTVTDEDGDTDTLRFSVVVESADLSPNFVAGSGPEDQTYTVGTAIGELTLPEATGGDGTLTYSLSREIPGLTFDASTRRLTGTPTTAGTYEMTYRVRDTDGDTDSLTFTITVSEPASEPDLVVESVSVSDSNPTAGGSFTLSATVRNRGDGESGSTTLRYYRSSNATISGSDTQVGTESVSGLSSSDTSTGSISLTAPSSAGTFYYGACVDTVTGESDTANNCSSSVSVTVSGNDGDLGACRAGLVVNPGESCTYKGYDFTVSSSGRGSIAFFSAGSSIRNTGTINGVRWDFHASKNENSNSWTIHRAN